MLLPSALLNLDTESPIVAALATIISATNPQSAVRIGEELRREADIWVASSRRDADTMWAVDAAGQSPVIDWICADGDRIAVIVWEGIPNEEGKVDAARWLTPIDWAVTMSLRAARNSGDRKPRFRVMIVDVRARDERAAASSGTFAILRGALPWIQVYRPVTRDQSYAATAIELSANDPSVFQVTRALLKPGEQDAERLITDIRNGFVAIRSLADAEVGEADVASVQRMWSSLLLKAGSRHDVANIVGPLVLRPILAPLLQERLRGVASPAQRAFLNELELLDLLRLSAPGDVLPADGLFPPGMRMTAHRPDRVVLIDDHENNGYREFVGCALFGREYLERPQLVSGTPNPFSLLEEICRAGLVQDWSRARRLSYADVLLLDLRLWSDGPEGASDAAAVLKAVCDAYEMLGASQIRSDEIKIAYRAADRFLDSPSDGIAPEALALLPLLVSYYDAAIPIIIFSSSQQRSVLNLLRERPNIIVEFAKPAVGGYVAEVAPREFAMTLRAAAARAADLYTLDTVWKKIASLEPGRELTWPHLRILAWGGEWPETVCKLPVSLELVRRIVSECERTLLSGLYADALQAPYTIMETTGAWPQQPWAEHPKDRHRPKKERSHPWESPDARAEYAYWGVLGFCRHARAHGYITAEDNHAVRDVAVFLWTWFVSGLLAAPLTTKRDGGSAKGMGKVDDLPEKVRGVKLFADLVRTLNAGFTNGVEVADPDVRNSFAWLQRKG